MNTKQQEGYDLMAGAIKCLARTFAFIVIVGAVLIILFDSFHIATDDSDTDGWHRSGLFIRKDAKTGIEYLIDGHGGMVRRGEK